MSYKLGHYDLAGVGITAIIDGILAEVYDDKTTVNINKRLQELIDRIENNEDIDSDNSHFYLLYSSSKMSESLSKAVSFNSKEPEMLNRHWIMHGRREKELSRLDCIKLIRFMYAITRMNEIIDK